MADSSSNTFVVRCPSCGVELVRNAVLCISCGYHLEKGVHLVASAGQNPHAPIDHDNPYRSPSETTASRQERDTVTLLVSVLSARGRIPRSQWWMFQAGYFVVVFAVATLGGLMDNAFGTEWGFVAFCVVDLIAIWLAFAAQVKRWHDMDRSGFWCLVNLIPLFGPLYALIELGFQRGTKGRNEYGTDPLGE